jgi:SSS family solute:Na+ symporter
MDPRKIAWVALSPNAKDMAENFYRALWSFLIAVGVTVVVSLFTKPKTASELKNLVFGYTDIPNESGMPFFRRPLFWALGVVAIFALLQWIFW